MPLNAELLAQKLWQINGAVQDSNGVPQPPTDAIKAYARGIVKMVQASIFMNLPGTITGTTSSGSPVQQGAGVGGKFMVVPAPIMVAEASGSNPMVIPMLTLEATAISTYILGAAMISFQAGGIQGTSTEVPPPTPAPGPLVMGSGSAGKVSGMSGPALAAIVKAATANPGGPTMEAHYTEIVSHIQDMGMASYKPGCVIGTCFNTLVGSGMGGAVE